MKRIDQLWKLLEGVELVQVRSSEMEAMYQRIFEVEGDHKPFIVEIGSAHGASSIVFAEAAKELDGHLVCIDHFPEEYYNQDKFGDYARKAFKKNIAPWAKWVTHIDQPSELALKKSEVDEVGIYLENIIQTAGGIDFLFVDGMHSYEAVQKDCQLYLPLVRRGGYIGFHDYNNHAAFPGVKQAADEACAGWQKVNDVWDAVVFRKP